MQRKKERKRARDMDRDHTFDLPDLTEDFWKTVVFAQEDPPSGMGGPGCVCLLSKEGKEYIFGFEETPFYKSTELFRSLRRPMKELVIVINTKQKSMAGNIWSKKKH